MNRLKTQGHELDTAKCTPEHLYYWTRQACEQVHRLIEVGEYYDAADLLIKIMNDSSLRTIQDSYYLDLDSSRQREYAESAAPDGLGKLDFWDALNECWFAFQDVPDKQLLLRLCKHLIKLCNKLEAFGLVDYEMGIQEESIVDCFLARIDEVERIEKEYRKRLDCLFRQCLV